jgi:diguanylate cyclase (GGDEF)-like protein/PAS domain S-box-containing protein
MDEFPPVFSEAMFRSLVEATSEFIGTIDREGLFVYLNPAGRVLLEIPLDESIVGQSVLPYNEGPSEEVLTAARIALKRKTMTGFNIFVSRSGKRIPVLQTFIVHETAEGTWYSTIARDISDRIAMEEDLRRRAEQDSLTGLLNRRAFHERVGELDRSHTYHLAMLDLNGFKGVNDRLGHAVGDEVLQLAAQELSAVCGAEAIVARLGGDEFVVVARWAPEMISLIQDRVDCTLQSFGASVAIGVTALESGVSVSDAMRTADILLYENKMGQPGRLNYRAQQPTSP